MSLPEGTTAPILSIVVPVYRAERYLDTCIESIVNQSFQEFELILVDDGSPDRSGEICDNWATRDSRVRVIHQSNSGVSAARNRGLDAALGDLIGFVDADDWVEPDMYEVMVDALKSSEAELVVCNYYVDTRRGASVAEDAGAPKSIVLPGEQALADLCRPTGLGVMVWNKVFRSRLLSGIDFRDTGQSQSEDFDVVARCLKRLPSVLRLSYAGYHYRQTKSSLMHSGVVSMSGVEVAHDLEEFALDQVPSAHPLTRFLLASYILDAHLGIARARRASDFAAFLRTTRPLLKEAWATLKSPSLAHRFTLPTKRRAALYLAGHRPLAFRFLYVPVAHAVSRARRHRLY
nr:glycosyltransferase [Propionicimonas sp.]